MTEEIVLTKGQADADLMLKKFFESEEPYACITGSAGCGKTYMIHRVTEHVPIINCVFVAATNKAVGEIAKRLPPEADTMTLHRFLGLKVKKSKGVTTSYRKPNYDLDDWDHVTTVVCDESSTLDDNLMDLIAQDIEDSGRQYIMVGDPFQLPPIEGKQSSSKSFSVAPEEFTATLTEIVRQAADNPIIKVATGVRDAIRDDKDPDIKGAVNEETGQGVYLLPPKKFFAKMRELAESPRIHEDVDYLRVIAWKNTTTKRYNAFIRETLGMDVSVPFQSGDVVVVNSAFERDGEILAGTGSEVVVGEMREHTHPRYGFAGWQCMLKDAYGRDKAGGPFCVIAASAEPAYFALLNELRDNALDGSASWQGFYALQGFYMDLRSPYSITAHKSQGSTFENVFIDLGDIYLNGRQATADKCYYVALTRASRAVYVRM